MERELPEPCYTCSAVEGDDDPSGTKSDEPLETDYKEEEATPTSPGRRQYELTNHLGNVMAVFGEDISKMEETGIDGNSVEYYIPQIISQRDYLPFGLSYSRAGIKEDEDNGNGYRYGFNGKEKDTEGEWGASTIYDYGFRVYDPAIARFLSVDPLAPEMPEWSSYCYAFNNPIYYIDPDGRKPESPLNDYLLDAEGNVKDVIFNDSPDRYFFENSFGEYDFNGVNAIQVFSPQSLTGDVKANERFNAFNGSIFEWPDDEIKRMVNEGVNTTINHGQQNGITKGQAIAEMSQPLQAIDYDRFFLDGALHKIQGIHYNSHEALNLLWGASLSQLGVDVSTAIAGAVGYHGYAYFNLPRYRSAGIMNESNHNGSIIMGYNMFDKIKPQIGLMREEFARFVHPLRVESNNEKRSAMYRDYLNRENYPGQ